MAKENKYNNFSEALEKEKNPLARKHLDAFYNEFLGNTKEEYDIHYDDACGKLLQSSGVDRVFVEYNQFGSVKHQIWIQEKICDSNYPNFMFEIKKKSGADGWAIDKGEKSDYIVYYHAGEITVIGTGKLRKWIIANLSDFKRSYYYKTDNHNINVPKHIVRRELEIESYQLSDYFSDENVI